MSLYRMDSDVGGWFDVAHVFGWGSCGVGMVWIVFEETLEIDRMWEGAIW